MGWINHDNIKAGIMQEEESYSEFIRTLVNSIYSDMPRYSKAKRYINPEISENDFPAAKAWKEFLVKNMGLKVVLSSRFSNPCFKRDTNEVHMPIRCNHYKTSAGYWNALLHECIHWAYNLSENSQIQQKIHYSSQSATNFHVAYAVEELIAQFGSIILKNFFGISWRGVDRIYLERYACRMVFHKSRVSILDCFDCASERAYLLLEGFLKQD